MEAVVGEYAHRIWSVGIDESLAVERCLGTIDALRRVLLIEHLEVLLRASYDVGILKVVYEIGRNLHHVSLVSLAEIHVIIDDGTSLACVFE